ncbi:MAG: WD40 repeat domain-containing protein [Scytonematopsis contorta HA4267-MV1]|jgi:WD40 repeat protein|nr:WD40 repeat domain-containing protein [Scytonematopsis contorta HA4267-MV1]
MNYGILSDNHSDNCSIHVEKDAISSAIISGNGHKVVIYQYQLERQVQEDKASSATEISSNPYKGLLAFQSEDADQYFGREKQIEKLWNLFQTLHEDTTQAEASLRLLPILGPSGSGKSSLARAGLIPEIARCPLSVKSQPRVVVLVPGTHPLEALATVLARVATNDQIPVAKTREFTEELQKASKTTIDTTKNTIIYDGLRRIANALPSIATSSLIVLVDQFEEVYSLCHDSRERQIFIENLINAAGDSSGYVSVIITVRSDFLGEIQRHSALNQVIAKQGVIVPAMTELELRRAITKPAENAGYSLDEAIVNLLLKDTEGREGALPLLQFALTRIWSGLKIGVQPAQTLNQMGGVGGALADEAQRIFENLNSDEKKIAQRVFLGLVQLGEGTRDTRRRCKISSLVSYRDEPEQVKKVINKFANPGVRLITLSSLDGTETAEVTHEALFANWGQLKKWLDSSRNDIRFGRRLDEGARVWHENGRSQGSLWRPPDLDLLAKYYERAKDNMTPLQVEFFHAAVNAEELKKQATIEAEKERKLQRQLLTGALSAGLLLTTTALGFALYQWQSAEQQRMEQNATTAKLLLSTDPAQAMVAAINTVELSNSPLLSFPKRLEPASVKSILFSAVQSNREINLLKGHQGIVRSVAISTDGNIIISGGDDGTVRLWNREGKQISKPFKGHKGIVRSVAISTDSNVVISGGDDGTVRLWTREGKPIGKPFQSHGGSVYSIAISTDNQTIISGGNDGTLHQWTREGHLIGKPLKGHQGIVRSVAISNDGKTIISAGKDGTVRLWTIEGKPIFEPFKGHKDMVRSVTISTDGKTIISGGDDGTVRLWTREGKQIGEFKGHQGRIIRSVAISSDGKTIISGGEDGTLHIWNREGKLIDTPFKGHQGWVTSVAISSDGKTIISGGEDGTVRLWDIKNKTIGKSFKAYSDV